MGHRSDTFWACTRIFSFGKPVSLTEKTSYSKLYRGYSLKQQQLIFIAHQTDYKELISLRAGSRVDSQLALLADILFCPLLLGACSHTTKLITLPLSLPFKIQTVNTSNTLSMSLFCFIAIQRLYSLACLTVYRSVSFNSSSNSTKMVERCYASVTILKIERGGRISAFISAF